MSDMRARRRHASYDEIEGVLVSLRSTEQAVRERQDIASLPAAVAAQALRLMLEELREPLS